MLSELMEQQRNCHYRDLKEQPIRKGFISSTVLHFSLNRHIPQDLDFLRFMLRLAQLQLPAEELYHISLKLEPREPAKLQRSRTESTLNLMGKSFDVLKRFSAGS